VRRPGLTALVAAAALAACMALAACGDDSRDSGPVSTIEAGPEITLTGNTTTLTLDGYTSGALETAGVKIEAVDPARHKGLRLVMPITGGTLTEGTLAGEIDTSGGIAFVAGNRRVAYEDLKIDTAVGQVFAGPSGKTPVFDLDTRALSRSDDAGVIVIDGVVALLSSGAAAELNEKLAVAAFKPRLVIGKLTVRAAGS
jgi:hypothetical protein